MPRLAETIAHLARHRRRWSEVVATETLTRDGSAATGASRFQEVASFGSDPGRLRMLAHVPDTLAPTPALVVVLHGCNQTAGGYDRGAGWSTLADRHGFALLFPEQRKENNPQGCFNWFQPGDTGRDRGEALSIRQMIERMVVDHGIDRRRIFVTGLSAGGAMTSVMLATYPEIFAGGAIIAGLPYGCAASVQDAYECMFNPRSRSSGELAALVRSASPHDGPWPKVSVWHGTADTVVKPSNAGETVKQWVGVHGLSAAPSREDRVASYPHRVWLDASGEKIVEEFVITGMAHGTPLAAGDGAESLGAPGPFLLEAGISSSHQIATFWGLTDRTVEAPSWTVADAPAPAATRHVPAEPLRPGARQAEPPRPRPTEHEPPRRPRIDVGAIITKALTAAGLMK